MPDRRVIKRGKKQKLVSNLAQLSHDPHSQRTSLLRAGSSFLPIQMSQTAKFNPVREEEDDEIVAYGEVKNNLASVVHPKRLKIPLPIKATIQSQSMTRRNKYI